jgi:hypothetical protein
MSNDWLVEQMPLNYIRRLPSMSELAILRQSRWIGNGKEVWTKTTRH